MKKIKISIKLLIITLGLLLLMQVPTFAATGKSNGTNVRVRKTPSTSAEIVEILAQNDKVEILGEEGDWYKIKYNNKVGYVSQSLITTEDKKSEDNLENVNNNKTSNEQENQGSEENNATENNEQNSENANGNNEQNNQDENKNNEQNTENQENANQNAEETNSQEVAQEPKATITNKIYKVAEKSNVKILPVITSESIGEVKENEEVTLLENAGLWVYIKANSVSGWIRIDKLSTEDVKEVVTTDADTNVDNKDSSEDKSAEETKNDEDSKKEENNESQQSNYTPKTMYSKVSATNVRSKANTSSDIVKSIGLNTVVKVVGEEDGWYQVEVDGKKGYIREDLLSNEKTEVSSRSNDLDRTATAKKEEKTTTEVTITQATDNNNASVTTVEKSEPAQATTSSSGVTGTDIVNYAMQFKGCKYVYGAAGPNSFDCSGLTMYVYKHFGYSLSHSSKVQATQGKAVTGELQPGDILVFSNNGKTVGHVGLYIGNDKFIHASDSSTGVIISNLSDRWNKSKYWGARRIL